MDQEFPPFNSEVVDLTSDFLSSIFGTSSPIATPEPIEQVSSSVFSYNVMPPPLIV